MDRKHQFPTRSQANPWSQAWQANKISAAATRLDTRPAMATLKAAFSEGSSCDASGCLSRKKFLLEELLCGSVAGKDIRMPLAGSNAVLLLLC